VRRTDLERRLDEADSARKQAVKEWREFVDLHCGFDKETGMPTRPETLPEPQVKELGETMKHWNKEWARLCVQLEKEQSTHRRTA